MFPKLFEDTKDLVPEAYFGGERVPPYNHARTPTTKTLDAFIASIRDIGDGANISGYIDDKGIHFHIDTGDTIRVDLSQQFVFVSQPQATDGADFSPWQVFFFLQEPVRKILFIGAGRATLVEKSQQTLKLCTELDRIWARDEYQQLKTDMVDSDEARDKALAVLMKSYESETAGISSEMWEFWDTFGELLMERHLSLKVQVAKTA